MPSVKEEIPYTLKRVRRARGIRITVKPDASVLVTMPFLMPEVAARAFIRHHKQWILKKISFFRKHVDPLLSSRRGKKDYTKSKEDARTLATKKVREFNALYTFRVGRISIRNQKTRWGSCSKQGNLSFNYRIVFLPEHLQNYIVVHELCHIKHMNHSQKFWDEVGRAIPDYKKARKELKRHHF